MANKKISELTQILQAVVDPDNSQLPIVLPADLVTNKATPSAIVLAALTTQASASRTALGLGSAALVATGTTTGTIPVLVATNALPAVSATNLTNFPTLNQNTSGSAATLTTTRSIYGSNFNGSAAIAGPIIGTYGGTGVDNSTRTITIGGNVVFSGAYAFTGTLTAATGVTFPTTGTLGTLAGTETLTNKRVTPRTGSTTSSATPTINTDNVDMYSLTAQTADITSFTTNLSGTPSHGDSLVIEITGTAARAITWGTGFEASTVALPTTTVTTAMLTVGFLYNSTTSKWRCLGAA